jgi:hypothetical protein
MKPETGLSFERVVFFSGGVFAIVIRPKNKE